MRIMWAYNNVKNNKIEIRDKVTWSKLKNWFLSSLIDLELMFAEHKTEQKTCDRRSFLK